MKIELQTKVWKKTLHWQEDVEKILIGVLILTVVIYIGESTGFNLLKWIGYIAMTLYVGVPLASYHIWRNKQWKSQNQTSTKEIQEKDKYSSKDTTKD